MMRSSPASAWSRRALVRSSMALMFGVSSMYTGASASAFIAGASRAKSISSRKPVRRRCESMLATERQQAQDELLLAHLEAEDADDLLLVDRGVLGEVEREARLADRRSRGDEDEVGSLEARRHRVEVGEAGADAADLALVLVEVVEPVVGGMKERLQRGEARADPLLADREELLLGAVDDLADVAVLLVAEPGDPTGRADEVAQHALALDDAGVVDGVDRRRREVDEARQVGRAADLLEATLALEDLADRDDVDRLATLVEVEDGRVDRAVVAAGRSPRAGAAPRPR